MVNQKDIIKNNNGWPSLKTFEWFRQWEILKRICHMQLLVWLRSKLWYTFPSEQRFCHRLAAMQKETIRHSQVARKVNLCDCTDTSGQILVYTLSKHTFFFWCLLIIDPNSRLLIILGFYFSSEFRFISCFHLNNFIFENTHIQLFSKLYLSLLFYSISPIYHILVLYINSMFSLFPYLQLIRREFKIRYCLSS